MDSVKVKPHASSNVSGLVRKFGKVLRFKADHQGVAQRGRTNHKFQEKEKPIVDSGVGVNGSSQFLYEEDEKKRNRASIEAMVSKVFASVSTVKAAYAQLQIAQSPYDPESIQSADQMVISELKFLSGLKQSFLKKTIDPAPEAKQLLAEVQEQQSRLKTYEIMGKKLESQLKLQDSEITFLREKLGDCDEQNRTLEQRLNPSASTSGSISILGNDQLHFSGLNPTHFITVLRHAVRSIRAFTKLMVSGMESSRWDMDAAATSIELDSSYRKASHRAFIFESYVCKVMFDGFQHQSFGLLNHSMKDRKQHFQKFNDLKSRTPQELITDQKLDSSTFGRFFKAKYLQLVHPKMEMSFFGDVNQRNLISSGKYPETKFCSTFGEMAKRVWLLHCLAFSFDPEASIFQVRKGCRFSEVFMENVVNEPFEDMPSVVNPRVCFTVVPGFKIGKTVLQSQVYLYTPKT